ncbi:uncharacterized protein [Panulirus ornatus]|uniref:uncharacterized protein n=1 Tax=Panulirus ornatus TaxID=150431 RepID=UPI003A883E38
MVLTRRSSSETESSTPNTSRGKSKKDVKTGNSSGTPDVVSRLVSAKRTTSVSSTSEPTPPTRRSKRLASCSQDVVGEATPSSSRLTSKSQDVVSVQTPSRSRQSRTTSSDDYVTPVKRSRRSSTEASGHQDTPVVHTPRRRRSSSGARDTPAASASVRRSRRLSADTSIPEWELSSDTPPGSSRSSEEEIAPLPKEIEEQTDSESTTQTLESISEEEEEDTPLPHSSDIIEVRSVCEVEEVQIVRQEPETLPVIEKEKLDDDIESISVNEEGSHIQEGKTKGLAVIEEVKEEKEGLTKAVKPEDTKEVVKEPDLILTEEPEKTKEVEKEPDLILNEEKEETEEVIKEPDLILIEEPEKTKEVVKEPDLILNEEKEETKEVIKEPDLILNEEKEETKEVEKEPDLILTEEKEEIKEDVKESALTLTEEVTEKSVDEKEQEVVALDTGFDGRSNCSASSTTGVEKDDLVVADETVSTTVTTDEDYISSSRNEIKSDDLTAAPDKGLAEGASKDLEVTSTTNIGVSANQKNELSGRKKIKPAVNNNIEVSDGKEALENLSELKNVTRGVPISGRWWKKEKQRCSFIMKDATGKRSWRKKMRIKQERQDVLAVSAAIREEKQRKKDELKRRQELNKIRQAENAKKSEIVQVIKDPRKIKKMKRKQLRYIEKRDTTELQKLQS